MAGEPVLSKGQSSEWVVYLQQVLRHYGYWPGPDDGAFDDDLEAAVQRFQSAYHLGADGVVRADTWAALTGVTTQSSASEPATSAAHADGGHADGGQADGGHSAAAGSGSEPAAMHGTGAQATEFPASFEAGGLPAFRYTLPRVPIAEAHFDTGAASVHLELSLTGSVTVTFPHSAPGVTTTLNDASWRVSASNSLDGLTSGIRVNGLGTDNVSFGTTFAHGVEQTEARFTPPNTMSFIGSWNVSYEVDTDHGTAQVQGTPGYQLDVTVTPHPTAEPVPVVVDDRSWVSEHGPALVAAGVVVLIVVVAVAAAPETGGGSLVLLTAL